MKITNRFIFNISLTLLYLLTIVSLEISPDEASIWNNLHEASGMLLLAGSFIHLSHHPGCLGKIFIRPVARTLHRRISTFFLFFFSILCAFSGLLLQIFSEAPHTVTRLHAFSGIIFLALSGIHLLRRYKWFPATLRQSMKSEKGENRVIIS